MGLHPGADGQLCARIRDRAGGGTARKSLRDQGVRASGNERDRGRVAGQSARANVTAWEAGELFPTKRLVDAMNALRSRGKEAVVRAPRGKAAAKTGQQRLADPAFWRIVRKLVEHPALFDEVSKLSEKYSDPGEPSA